MNGERIVTVDGEVFVWRIVPTLDGAPGAYVFGTILVAALGSPDAEEAVAIVVARSVRARQHGAQ